ncbi:MAG: NAD(P)-dependent oxidoreductase [Flavobacteriaceae bacterium]
MEKMGVIGLGNMGEGMACSLQRSGYEVIATARTRATRDRVAARGIRTEATIAAVAARADTIVLSLPMPSDVALVIEGPGGVLENLRPGMLVIDTSTSDPQLTKRLASRIASAGARMIDAPVSGGAARAMDGTLTMMIGCPDDLWLRVEPVLKSMSARQIRIGDIGAGHVAKLANNLLLASHLAVAGEVMHMVERAGVDVAAVLDAVNAGTGRSNVTEHNFRTWILPRTFNSGFSAELMHKDVRLASHLLEALGLDLPVVQSIAQRWARACKQLAASDDFNRVVDTCKSH